MVAILIYWVHSYSATVLTVCKQQTQNKTFYVHYSINCLKKFSLTSMLYLLYRCISQSFMGECNTKYYVAS